MNRVIIIGAGFAGLSASITLAEKGIPSHLISLQPSERAQSVLAEGGINGALNTMGEDDNTENHFQDTMKGGVFLADPNAVDNLTKNAPDILRWLEGLGVPFNKNNGDLVLRNFGGQKKKRTAYARSSTGKIMMSAVIDEARKYESKGLIQRWSHHCFLHLLTENNVCQGARIQDVYTGEIADFRGNCCFVYRWHEWHFSGYDNRHNTKYRRRDGNRLFTRGFIGKPRNVAVSPDNYRNFRKTLSCHRSCKGGGW